MTNHYIDMKNSSCFLIFSNPVENHPVCAQYINEAIDNGAKVLVAEPRRTRTSSLADRYVRFRPGTDIAFINGILKRHFANVDADASGTASFSGAGLAAGPGAYMRTTSNGSNWFDDNNGILTHVIATLQWPKWTDSLFRTNEGFGTAAAGEPNDYLRYGRDVNATTGNYVVAGTPSAEAASDPNSATYLANASGEGTFANENQLPVLGNDLNAGAADGGTRTVYEVYRDRVAGYDGATVADICGCTATEFEALADEYLANSWAYNHESGGGADVTNYKAATILYAMGTTQHTHGAANVKSYANLQICTGNIGKHGGGVNALRGIGNVQGSTDMNLLYHILMAYVAVPAKYKIVGVVNNTTVDVSGKPPVHNYAPDNALNAYGGSVAGQPEVCSRVVLGNKNGFLKAGASTYSYNAAGPYANSGTPVASVTPQGGGIYRVVTSDPLTAGLPAVGDTLFPDYESWLYQKSFGGRRPMAAGGANAVFPGGWSFSGGLPWGHQGSWAVIRTFFSEGQAGNVGGLAADTPAVAGGHVNDLYNNYLAKGAGYDHRTMVNQTDASMPGWVGSKTQIKGMVVWGMNPRVTVGNATNVGDGLQNLDWLVVADMFRSETANAARKAGAPTYFLPAASPIETAGTTSNSGRWIQWRFQAVPPRGDAKTDLEILFKLAHAMHTGFETVDGTDNWLSDFAYGAGATAYNNLWLEQYAGSGGNPGILTGTQDGAWQAANGALADPATAWSNDNYRASYQGEDNGIGNAGLGYSGYAERVAIQTNTNSNDMYGNAGCNWLHGSKRGGGGQYGAWHDPNVPLQAPPMNTMLDEPTDNAGYAAHADDTVCNRTQAQSPNDSAGNKGLYPGFSWVWLRNRRVFYNKGGFCPGDIGDIFVSPDEVGTTFMGVPGYTDRPPVVSYTGCWRGSRNLKDIPIVGADASQWAKRGYTPAHWEPHESPRPDLIAAYGQIGKPSVEPYANTPADRTDYPFVLTTFRHTEHFQGGPMTRNIPWLIELIPRAVIEINPVDAAAYGIKDGYKVWLSSKRATNVGPFYAVVGNGLPYAEKVGKGVLAIPWHWGSEGLATGPTANELTTDALDGNTNMPETKACLCKISSVSP